MKKKLMQRSGLFVLFLVCLFGKSPDVKAQAFDMIYPDSVTGTSTQTIHNFTIHLYQNCSPAPTNYTNSPISYTVNGNAPVHEVLTTIPITGMGAPFCPSVTASCSPTGLLNYQKSGGTTTFTSKANTSAPGLSSITTKFGVTGFGNYLAANIAGIFSIEPQIFNVLAAGLTNYAPKFINPPVIFANVNQPVSFSSAAIDKDGDSLVYRLRPVSPGASYVSGFTYLNPITANPALALNSRTGIITFKPTAYDQAAGPGAAANKYVIGLDVDEYRKLNGVATKIGTIQRNVLVNVISNANQSPALTASQLTQGSQAYIPVAPNTIIDAYPGTQLKVSFGASDPDVLDYVYPVPDGLSVLPGSKFGITLGSNPNGGQLIWTPTAADVRDEPYFFNVSAIDDACPYPASVTNTYGIRVRNITGLKSDPYVSATFQAYPNPAKGDVNFKITAGNVNQKILIYNILGQEIDQVSIPVKTVNEQIIRWENASKYAAGTYIAKLFGDDNSVQTLKFTKLQ